jgi:hypothetical protein
MNWYCHRDWVSNVIGTGWIAVSIPDSNARPFSAFIIYIPADICVLKSDEIE